MEASGTSTSLDFTARMRELCIDLTARLDELSHIDVSRIAIRCCQTRRQGLHGVQATLTPLRFAGGRRETMRGRGRNRGRWTIRPLFDADGRELLYVLSFYVPRFLNQSKREKLATVCHELWHVSPACDGDIRRHAGRCFAHGRSEAEYHARMQALADRWLQLDPPERLHAFLDHDFRELTRRHGAVVGTRLPTPRLMRVDEPR